MEEIFTFFDMGEGDVYKTSEPFVFENESIHNNWMDIEFDGVNSCSEMSLFKEFDGVQEVEEPSTATTKTELTNTNTLSQLVTQCGIPTVEDIATYPCSPASSLDSDMESHQNLIDELEEFFGSPTVVDDEASKDLELLTKSSVVCQPDPHSILDALVTGQVFSNNGGVQLTNKPQEILYDNQITSCVTEDGQNVIIIIAPPSPTASVTSSPLSPATSTTSCYDTDPEWVPSPSNNSLSSSPPTKSTVRRKYQRIKPLVPPSGPYPVEKKERKKAQNRTAAFRYREKKKGEMDEVENELEQLSSRNDELRNKLSEMETEARLLKKLMTEAGLGRFAATLKL